MTPCPRMEQQPIKTLLVWAHPRTRSTALERPFLTRDDVEVVHEPLSEACFFGPERTTVRYSAERIAAEYSQYANATFEDCWERAIVPAPGKKLCFIKELAKHVFIPKRHSDFVPELPSFANDGESTSALKVTANRSLAGNPTLIPSEKLFGPNIVHVFLIRRPSDYLVSLVKKLCSPVGDGWFNEEELGVHETRRLYDFIASRQSEAPLVIDSDDLLIDPGAVIKHLCDLVGLEYNSKMLTWEANDAKAAGLFAKWKGWHETALNSTGIMPMLSPAELEKPSPEVAAAIADLTPDFEYLKSKAYRFA